MYRVPNELIDLFADLIDDKQSIKYVAERAGLPLGMVELSGSSKVLWLNVLKEAVKHGMLKNVIDAVSADYPKLKWDSIHRLVNYAGDCNSVRAPTLDDLNWHSRLRTDELEKITGSQPTFLPLHFFELGQLKSKSVALVQLPSGSGTGFLIDNNLLLTNNHVIGDVASAKAASVIFNYQHELNGSPAKTTTYSLSPENGFSTSKSHDWTAVRLDGEANSDWGAISLEDCQVDDGEYVNIVQHPMGGPKVVAMYHNVVVFSDDDRIQYLTDTLPGSSGSPVFRSDWSLVGIHHAGGPIAKDGSVRNEGIAVRRLIADLKSIGLI